jgi:hypothetical protein
MIVVQGKHARAPIIRCACRKLDSSVSDADNAEVLSNSSQPRLQKLAIAGVWLLLPATLYGYALLSESTAIFCVLPPRRCFRLKVNLNVLACGTNIVSYGEGLRVIKTQSQREQAGAQALHKQIPQPEFMTAMRNNCTLIATGDDFAKLLLTLAEAERTAEPAALKVSR